MASAEGLRRSVKGLSESEFRERFGTEEACRKALFDMRWREGLACPACGHRGLCALKTRKLFQCNRCKKQVRLTAGTVFQDTELPLTAWFTAIYHLAQGKNGISSIELGAQARGEAADSVADQAQADAGATRPRASGLTASSSGSATCPSCSPLPSAPSSRRHGPAKRT